MVLLYEATSYQPSLISSNSQTRRDMLINFGQRHHSENTAVAFSPSSMLEVPAPNIAGASVTNTTFALVNQNGEDLSTLNEQWQLVVEIVW